MGPVSFGRKPNVSPITRAAGDGGTGSRGRKPDASLDCHPKIDRRWSFSAHRNPQGGCDRVRRVC